MSKEEILQYITDNLYNNIYGIITADINKTLITNIANEMLVSSDLDETLHQQLELFDSYNEQYLTELDGIKDEAALSQTNAKISETNAALYAERADLALIPKGYYNPTGNSTIDGALTNTPDPAFVDGAYYEVDSDGVSQIDGANFDIGDDLHIGDRIEKIGTQWNLKPNPTTNFALNLDTQAQLKFVSHITPESIGALQLNGSVIDTVARTITVPNTTSGLGSHIAFSFTKINQYDWTVGDTIYLEVLVTENVANISNIGGQQLRYNLNVIRTVSGTPTLISDVAIDPIFQRLNPTQVLLSFKYVITTGDTEFISFLQKVEPGSVNNSGGFWRWTVENINYHITKSTETLNQISTKLNNLSAQIEDNRLYKSLIYNPVESVLSAGGLVYKNDNRIVIPNNTTGSNTYFWKLIPLTQLPDYKVGDKIKFIFLIKESVPGSLTAVTPNRITANIWMLRSAVINVVESSKIERFDSSTVRITLTATITTDDIELRPGIIVSSSATNTTGSNLEFTVLSIDALNLKETSLVTNNTDILNKIVETTNLNTQEIINSELALTSINNTLEGSPTSGATYSGTTLTIPVGQHGLNSFVVLRFPVSTSPVFSDMIDKTVTFEYIAKVSPNLFDRRKVFLQMNSTTGGVVIGDRAVNPEIIYIDSTHIKLKFDYVVKFNDTILSTYVQFNDTIVVTDTAQTIELQNKIYYSWKDSDQINSNVIVLENNTKIIKTELISYADSNIYLPLKVLSGGTAEVAGVTVNVNADTITINSGINPGFSFLFKRNITANYPDWIAGKEIKYYLVIDENQPGISETIFYKLRVSLNSTIGGVYQERASTYTYERLDSNTVMYTITRTILANESSVDIILSTYGYVNNTGSSLIYTWKNLSYKISNPTDAVNSNSQIVYNLTKRLTTVESIGAGGNAWVGSNIIWCGTSIPFNYQPNSYPNQIATKLGATVINTAIGGSKLLFPTGNSTPGMAGTIVENTAVNPSFAAYSYESTIMPYLVSPYNSKLLVIDHGFNDAVFTPAALGTIASTNKATFYGAYDYVIKAVLAVRPDIKIVLVTFPSRYPFGSTDPSTIANYESLRTAIKAIGDKWGFPVLDLGGIMGYNSITAVAGKFTTDGVHPTQDSTNKIADVGYRFLLGVS